MRSSVVRIINFLISFGGFIFYSLLLIFYLTFMALK
ncbi:hypothetical protein BBUCA8_01583 [Borreliella burgdorferi CA8]|nr:hypothetical protein BBUCA8_01583 [Borreliella burgdorferi CA8]